MASDTVSVSLNRTLIQPENLALSSKLTKKY